MRPFVSSRMRWFSSHLDWTTGVFGTNCCAKSPTSCPAEPATMLHAGVADGLVGSSGDDASDWRLVAFHDDWADG